MTIVGETEFTAFVQRQARFVFRVAYAVLLNRADAEDVVQETFLKLYRNGGWKDLSNERAFLARVAWRLAVDHRPRTVRPIGEAETILAELPSTQPSPEDSLLASCRNATLHAMIDALPDELRVPLVLSTFDELKSQEIGDILGVPEGTVRTRLLRARQLLRQKLGALEEVRHAR